MSGISAAAPRGDRGDRGPVRRARTVGAFFDLDGTLVAGDTAATFYGDRLRGREVSPGGLFLRTVVTAVDGELWRRPDADRARRVRGDARGVRGGVRRPRRAAVPGQDRRHRAPRVPRARGRRPPARRPHGRGGVRGRDGVPGRAGRARPRRGAPGLHAAWSWRTASSPARPTARCCGGATRRGACGAFARTHGVDLGGVVRLRQRLRGRRLPLLCRAHPTALNPHRDLRAAAARLGWPVLDLADPVGGSAARGRAHRRPRWPG